MIVEYIRYRVPEESSLPFEDAYRRAGAWLEASPHCQRYEVAGCQEEAWPLHRAHRVGLN